MAASPYLRPLPVGDPDILDLLPKTVRAKNGEPAAAASLAGGELGFVSVEVTRRVGAGVERWIAPLEGLGARLGAAPGAVETWLAAVTSARSPIADVGFEQTRVMGVLNVTPDSFSDGGVHLDPGVAVEAGLAMISAGADILDVGGESTRPGAQPVTAEDELARVLPVIRGLVAAGARAPISIDTRSARVAREAFAAGARIFNDVSALGHDPESPAAAAELCRADAGAGVVLCHSAGTPETMQAKARYDEVVLDVFDALNASIRVAVEAGVPGERLIVDPGIGFGKTLEHNVTLIRGLATFHGLGRPVLLGASRKRFIGTLSGVETAAERGPGSIAAALMGVAKGVQILRVHDVAETVQALGVWRALTTGRGAPAGETIQ